MPKFTLVTAKNDPVRTGIIIGLAVALLVFLGSMIAVLMMHAPTP